MIYQYQCPNCDKPVDVVKSVKHIDDEELCPQHKIPMQREFAFSGYTSVDNFIPGFNYSLGETFTNSYQQKEHIKRLQAETGREIIEVGNDSSVPKVNKPTPNMQEATQELNYLWRKR